MDGQLRQVPGLPIFRTPDGETARVCWGDTRRNVGGSRRASLRRVGIGRSTECTEGEL
jgi:hypothetical protein